MHVDLRKTTAFFYDLVISRRCIAFPICALSKRASAIIIKLAMILVTSAPSKLIFKPFAGGEFHNDKGTINMRFCRHHRRRRCSIAKFVLIEF